MDTQKIEILLEQVKKGEISVEGALTKLRTLPYEDLGFAKLDHHRSLRQGAAEVVYCPGKTPEQVGEIFRRLSALNRSVMATRATLDLYEHVKKECPQAQYHMLARMIVFQHRAPDLSGDVLVISAGTADLAVAEEAVVTASVLGSKVTKLYDVGVAGLHRLLDHLEHITRARVIVVVAGMEGALASVIGGLAKSPVIAVPTSVGYGASFNGLAALLSMLNSCAAGVSVVNIDNGFGAGYLAHIINRIGEKP
ncbi:MAG: nickel pincer cofactor biosynthesis protein LarB [Bacillota bacterium]